MPKLEFFCDREKAVALLRASRLYDKGIEMQYWIPVTKKSPEVNGWYIVAYKRRNIPAMKLARWNGKTWRNWIKLRNVLAWMPLPDPYKPEDNAHDN